MTARHLLNRSLAAGIDEAGFCKWYERERLSSRAHVALAMMVSFEAFQGASASEKVLNTGVVVVCAAISFWAMRRYLFFLMHAEEIAH